MKKFPKATTAILVTVLLAGCGGSSEQPKTQVNTGDTKPTVEVIDHHEGEENVEPHDDSEPAVAVDDHHEGEENVEPHDDEPSVAKPPSRSNLVEDHDDTGTDPHGH